MRVSVFGEMKPPYRVPSMQQIARIKPNGFKAISLFAGAGGSSLGYRLSGFRMLWASEFIDAARDCLSSFPDDFVLSGSYELQCERIGRAVPPLMAAAIATAIRDQVLIPAITAT